MNNGQNGNKCSRCGKQRVVVKTWEEKLENSVITNTLTACPDSECQKEVDKGIRQQEVKREKIEKERNLRMLANKAIQFSGELL